MTAYIARDGKEFPDMIRLRWYEGWVDSKAAPGGPDHVNALKEHGSPTKVTIEARPSRPAPHHRRAPDGHTSTVVHGSNEAAHSVLADLLDVNPPISQHPQRNASAPVLPHRVALFNGALGRAVAVSG